MHSWWNPFNWARNVETLIGRTVAGQGTKYEINIWIKTIKTVFAMDKMKNQWYLLLLVIVTLLIVFGNNGEHHLGNGFHYFEDPGTIDYWKRGDTLKLEIPAYVLSYKNTRKWLLVEQKPREFPNAMEAAVYYPYGRDTLYYYLIDKKEKTIMGPLLYSDMEAFLQEKNLERLLDSL